MRSLQALRIPGVVKWLEDSISPGCDSVSVAAQILDIHLTS